MPCISPANTAPRAGVVRGARSAPAEAAINRGSRDGDQPRPDGRAPDGGGTAVASSDRDRFTSLATGGYEDAVLQEYFGCAFGGDGDRGLGSDDRCRRRAGR